MNRKQALEIITRLRDRYEGTDNTTLGDIDCRCDLLQQDETAIDKLRDSFANITWDTSLEEAREIVLEETFE